MELTAKQEEGLKIAVSRFRNKEKYTVISGYAGVGKSFLVKHIIDALNVPPGEVAYATFTGRAAEVLRKKGNEGAITLHKLLYHSEMKKDGTYYHKPKKKIDKRIVVVDEVSMAPKSMMELLFSYPNVYVICLGDPG